MAESSLRRRGKRDESSDDCADAVTIKAKKTQAPPSIQGGSYWLTRVVFVRALGFVYCKSSRPI